MLHPDPCLTYSSSHHLVTLRVTISHHLVLLIKEHGRHDVADALLHDGLEVGRSEGLGALGGRGLVVRGVSGGQGG